jgi:hypothetical protein
MTENLRWQQVSEDFPLPDDVRAAMRDLLTEGLREAARKPDLGDGSMMSLGIEKIIGDGMWDGGWKLQASIVTDEQMNPKPFVTVHAYKDSTLTRGNVSSDVVRTAEDRRFLASQQLDSMIKRRDALNMSIEELTAELKSEGDRP